MNFTRDNLDKVLAGTKSRTTRLARDSACRYVVGRTYAVCPGRGKRAEGRIRITAVRRVEWFGEDIDDRITVDEKADHARREGFETWEGFVRAFVEINGQYVGGEWVWYSPLWVIDFELVKEGDDDR